MPDEVVHDSRRRRRRFELIVVVGFSLVVCVPFCNKAFHIDDPLYLSIARQILIDPVRPFDGLINWQQVTEPAWRVSISPPGYSYWLAGWLALGVTGEVGLHLAATFWVVVLGVATHSWASRLGEWSLSATLLVLSSPLVIAGQNLMLDVPMLALASSAMVVYFAAGDRSSLAWAVAAGLLAGLSVNVKYAGVVPLVVMLFDAVLWRRWRLLAAPLVGALSLAVMQMTIASWHGTPQLLFARDWITRLWPSDAWDMLHRSAASLVYLGAGGAWFILMGGIVFRAGIRGLWITIAAAAAAGLAAADLRRHEPLAGWAATSHVFLFAFPSSLLVIWFALAIFQDRSSKLAQILQELARSNQSSGGLRHAVILVAWTAGFWYLGTYNGPFVAPRAMVPIILSLSLATLAISPDPGELGRFFIRGSVVVTLLFGLLVGWGDYRWAALYRDHAPRLAAKYGPRAETVYFLGHWGWQHYAAQAGLVQLDPVQTRLAPGDLIILPRNVDCPLPLSVVLRNCVEVAREVVPAGGWLPRTRSPEGLIFLHGDTDQGRIPWGWPDQPSPYEVFLVFRYAG